MMAKIEWKTQIELEKEENQPTQQERLEALENALLELILRSDNDD